jgi:hypothetical protein
MTVFGTTVIGVRCAGSGAPAMVDIAVQDFGESRDGLSGRKTHIWDRFKCAKAVYFGREEALWFICWRPLSSRPSSRPVGTSDLEQLLRNDGRYEGPSPLRAASTAAARFVRLRTGRCTFLRPGSLARQSGGCRSPRASSTAPSKTPSPRFRRSQSACGLAYSAAPSSDR